MHARRNIKVLITTVGMAVLVWIACMVLLKRPAPTAVVPPDSEVWTSGALTTEGRLLKEELRLMDFIGPTNRYSWACPAQVSVSNQLFTIDECTREGKYFDIGLARQDGIGVGSCSIGLAVSADEALGMICDRITIGCSAPIQGASSAWHVERDTNGNVLLFGLSRSQDGNGTERDRSVFYRTYGNLYVRVAINTGRVSLGAWDFALPMIQAGLQPQH